MKTLRLFLFLPVFFLLAACERPSGPVGLVPPDQRAPQFDRVSEFLDLGGVFYAYMDLTGEAERLAGLLDEAVAAFKESNPDMPPLPLNFAKFLDAAGLSGMDAVGLSSVQLDNGLFHNRTILFFPDGVSGLFGVFGDAPHPFDSLDLAPASADLVWETDYRPQVLRDTVLEMAGALGGALGRGAISSQLTMARPEIGGRTPNQIIDSLGNRAIVIIEFVDGGEQMEVAPGISFPETRFLLGIDGATELLLSLRPAVEGQSDLEWTETDNGFEITATTPPPAPFGSLSPLLVADTTTGRMFIASDRSFLDVCLADGGKLKDTDAFKEAANLLPPEGVSFTYATPGFIEPIRGIFESSMTASPTPLPLEAVNRFSAIFFPDFPAPVASVTTVGPEGLYAAANLGTSHRATVASLTLQPTVMVAGLSAAMAIPAFQKVRENSQQKTVLNNLRQVASAGQQYLLEEGADRARYDQLEGEYFPPLTPVNGEDYTGLVVEAAGGTLSVTMANGETVEYRY